MLDGVFLLKKLRTSLILLNTTGTFTFQSSRSTIVTKEQENPINSNRNSQVIKNNSLRLDSPIFIFQFDSYLLLFFLFFFLPKNLYLTGGPEKSMNPLSSKIFL